ncbi:hypothetical protein NW767_014597 [Fusarium falciforme]|nr:hypothetical protein NW767_014597 [Fusarium falciforme]
MNPQAQIEDSLERGWIVVAPDHRLCPQVNILEGPMGDIRAFHKWVYDGHLDVEFASRSIPFRVDTKRIIATGTASGGHASLGLAYDPAPTPPPAAIISYYAPMNFAHPWWTGIRDKLDVNTPELTPEMEKMVFSQYPIPSRVDIPAKPDHTGKIRLPETDPANPTYESARIAYSTSIITRHELLDVSYPFPSDKTISPADHYRLIDPVANVHQQWPPTCLVHGADDNLLPHTVTAEPLTQELQKQGVECEFIKISGAKHMFAISMTRQSEEWVHVGKAMDWAARMIGK